jgi:hypothetical protein
VAAQSCAAFLVVNPRFSVVRRSGVRYARDIGAARYRVHTAQPLPLRCSSRIRIATDMKPTIANALRHQSVCSLFRRAGTRGQRRSMFTLTNLDLDPRMRTVHRCAELGQTDSAREAPGPMARVPNGLGATAGTLPGLANVIVGPCIRTHPSRVSAF